MAQIIGAALAMGLFGALFAWIIRRIMPLALELSYLIGVIIAVVVGSYVYTLGNEHAAYGEALIVYGIGGVIGLIVLILTSRGTKKPNPSA